MGDSSGPHILEELETKVEKMMAMMGLLLEAKSSGGGQQKEEEESGGTGKGAGHNYSGGAGRASPTTETGHGVTARSCSRCGGTRPQQKSSVRANKTS